jgi:two-component system CheB/CheR fusion protein
VSSNTDENSPSESSELVVVGSSAGGIEALSILVSALPNDFPAPIVLAQHLDPFRPSNLDQILGRKSTLPVVVVQETTKLQPGRVYVVPANRHVVIRDGDVMLEGDHGNRPRPSVDLLLSSAAESYGDRLIAVILTGSGSDGAAGAVEVKKAGGTVIIQNPETARYPSMPMALPPTAVDHIADLEQMGALLYDLVKGVDLPKPQEKIEDALRDVLLLVNRNHPAADLPPDGRDAQLEPARLREIPGGPPGGSRRARDVVPDQGDGVFPRRAGLQLP